MFPEKPKHSATPRRTNARWLLIILMSLPLPATILMNRRLPTSQIVDMMLIGIMLCCVVYLLYQGIMWMLAMVFRVTDESSIE